MYFHARYYAKELGRFMSCDPIKDMASSALTINPYVYCGNNPIVFKDPLGLRQAPGPSWGDDEPGGVAPGFGHGGFDTWQYGHISTWDNTTASSLRQGWFHWDRYAGICENRQSETRFITNTGLQTVAKAVPDPGLYIAGALKLGFEFGENSELLSEIWNFNMIVKAGITKHGAENIDVLMPDSGGFASGTQFTYLASPEWLISELLALGTEGKAYDYGFYDTHNDDNLGAIIGETGFYKGAAQALINLFNGLPFLGDAIKSNLPIKSNTKLIIDACKCPNSGIPSLANYFGVEVIYSPDMDVPHPDFQTIGDEVYIEPFGVPILDNIYIYGPGLDPWVGD
jgi:hypothetical protein